ncbi:MAG: large repetitive protein, partial [Actinomycetota bacterium]|nr:large repetitive protein [Actinomycetota bacterium]
MGSKFIAMGASVALAAGSFISLAVGATPAGADNVTVPLTCQTSGIPVVGSQTSSKDQATITSSPAAVFQNEVFVLTVGAPPETESSDLGSGATLNNIHDLHLRLPIPANSTLQSSSFTPGFGYGNGAVTLTQSGNNLVLYVQGPIPANQQWKLPTINMTLKATGSQLSNIQAHFGGTSYSDPGLDFIANANLPAPISSTNDLPTACYPSSSPALSTTLIKPPDTTAPAITINSPGDGTTYGQGAIVNASYSCDDGPFGTGVESCVGTVPNLSPIDTSTLGSHTFTVTTRDNAHNPIATKSVSYNVSGEPGVTVSGGWANEGAGNVVPFTVSLSQPTNNVATVTYTTQNGTATAGADFGTTSNTLTFNPGAPQAQTVNVPVVNDGAFEQPEAFTLTITGVTHALVTNGTATGRIRDDDLPAVRASAGSVTRGAGAVVPVRVSIQGPPAATVNVSYSTADASGPVHAVAGVDYTATSGSLAFTPGGPLVQTVNVPVLTAAAWKADALTFLFNATGPVNSTQTQGTILDANVHPPAISIGDVSVVETDSGPTYADVPVTLDRAAGVPVTVRYTTSGGNATPTVDYTRYTNKQLVF